MQQLNRAQNSPARSTHTLMLACQSLLSVVGSFMSWPLSEMPGSMLLALLLGSSTAYHFLHVQHTSRQAGIGSQQH
jgi:hypothetical protein